MNRTLKVVFASLTVCLFPFQADASVSTRFSGLSCTAEDEAKLILNAVKKNEETAGNGFFCHAGKGEVVDVDQSAITGARRVMALIYGTCDVLKMPVRGLLPRPASIPESNLYKPPKAKQKVGREIRIDEGWIRTLKNPTGVLKSHPYLASRLDAGDVDACKNQEEMNSCQKYSCHALKYPPVYQYGIRPGKDDYSVHQTFHWYFSKRPPHRNKPMNLDAPGIDCSSFVSYALASMGLKLNPSDPNVMDGQSYGSSGFLGLGKKNDCFDNVNQDPEIKSGDILVQDGHIVMVDSVGKDPYLSQEFANMSVDEQEQMRQEVVGKLKVKLLPQCKALKIANMIGSVEAIIHNEQCVSEAARVSCEKFFSENQQRMQVTIIHSSPHGEVGVQREKVIPGVNLSGSMYETFKQKAKSDCVTKVKTSWVEKAMQNKNELDAGTLAKLERFKKTTGLEFWYAKLNGKFLRHKSNNPACRVAREKLPEMESSECTACCDTTNGYQDIVSKESPYTVEEMREMMNGTSEREAVE